MFVVVSSFGYVFGSLIKTGMVLKKFSSLDKDVQNKLLLINNYMVAAKNLSKEELIKLSKKSERELEHFNEITDYDERVMAMKEKIK
jgi:hypothetical protein